MHENFRFFITTDKHPKWPMSIVEQCIKFTTEPPVGIKAGLKRTFGGMDNQRLETVSAWQWRKMLYSVCFLHRALQDRRRYGRIGWGIPYKFSDGDMEASLSFIQNYLDELPAKKPVSWKTIHYQIGEVQYGGRVSDERDRTLLKSLVEVWLNEDIFEDKFAFAKGYSMPHDSKYWRNGFKSLITHSDNTLPSVDKPEAVGLHPNAGINTRKIEGDTMLNTILSIQPKESSSGGSGESREDVVKAQAQGMLAKLPAKIPGYKVNELFLAKHAVHNGWIHEPGLPMSILLRQELGYFWKVAEKVQLTLESLILAVDGLVVMSDNLRDAFDAIYDGKIPQAWIKGSWESSTLGFWFTELTERWEQLSSWLFKGLPTSFRLGSFFNKNAFLTAILQESGIQNASWTLDKIKLKVEVTKYSLPKEVTRKQYPDDVIPPRPSEFFVHDLWLEGARWDKKKNSLAKQSPKVLHEELPILKCYGLQENKNSGVDKSLYECPVYENSSRTDLTFVTMISLNCPKIVKKPGAPSAKKKGGGDADGETVKGAVQLSTSDMRYWQLQGTAIICNTN